MGAGESIVRNVDKRTSRREHKDHFINAIACFRDRHVGKSLFNTTFVEDNNNNVITEGGGIWSIKVFVRKRPIFAHEIKQGEFDVITCSQPQEQYPSAIVHDARMHPNMRKLLMNHHEFHFDSVFGENATNEMVYNGSAKKLVKTAASGGTGKNMCDFYIHRYR